LDITIKSTPKSRCHLYLKRYLLRYLSSFTAITTVSKAYSLYIILKGLKLTTPTKEIKFNEIGIAF